jgi:hypothetical protein
MAYFEKHMEFACNVLIISDGVLLNMLISSVMLFLCYCVFKFAINLLNLAMAVL